MDIDRVRLLAERGGSAFLDQAWTAAEQSYCEGDARRLASRWAAKEAVMKALGAGYPEIEHAEIEVISVFGEAPRLALAGNAASLAAAHQLTEWSLSLAHENNLALAVVVASGGAS